MMKTGLVTDILGYVPFEEMPDTCERLGIESVELGCGNWSKAPHIQMDDLLESAIKCEELMDDLNKRGLSIAALNCSGNQLNPSEEGKLHKEGVEKTFQLAGLLGVETVVMMSGCPGGGPQDHTPNWLTHPILPQHFNVLDWQWNDVALPYWEKVVKSAESYGVKKIAIENLGYNLVHNPETLLKLRNEVGDMIGMNLDIFQRVFYQEPYRTIEWKIRFII